MKWKIAKKKKIEKDKFCTFEKLKNIMLNATMMKK